MGLSYDHPTHPTPSRASRCLSHCGVAEERGVFKLSSQHRRIHPDHPEAVEQLDRDLCVCAHACLCVCVVYTRPFFCSRPSNSCTPPTSMLAVVFKDTSTITTLAQPQTVLETHKYTRTLCQLTHATAKMSGGDAKASLRFISRRQRDINGLVARVLSKSDGVHLEI